MSMLKENQNSHRRIRRNVITRRQYGCPYNQKEIIHISKPGGNFHFFAYR